MARYKEALKKFNRVAGQYKRYESKIYEYIEKIEDKQAKEKYSKMARDVLGYSEPKNKTASAAARLSKITEEARILGQFARNRYNEEEEEEGAKLVINNVIYSLNEVWQGGKRASTQDAMRKSAELILDMIQESAKEFGYKFVKDQLEKFGADFMQKLERLVAAIYDAEYENSLWNTTFWGADTQGINKYISQIYELADLLAVKPSQALLSLFRGNMSKYI